MNLKNINFLGNTVYRFRINQIKSEISQAVDEYQKLLQNYLNQQQQQLIVQLQQMPTQTNSNVNSRMSFKQVFSRYQTCLIDNVNLGKLTINLIQVYQDLLINKQEQQKEIILKNRQRQSQLYEYMQILKVQNNKLQIFLQSIKSQLEGSQQKNYELTRKNQLYKKQKEQIQNKIKNLNDKNQHIQAYNQLWKKQQRIAQLLEENGKLKTQITQIKQEYSPKNIIQSESLLQKDKVDLQLFNSQDNILQFEEADSKYKDQNTKFKAEVRNNFFGINSSPSTKLSEYSNSICSNQNSRLNQMKTLKDQIKQNYSPKLFQQIYSPKPCKYRQYIQNMQNMSTINKDYYFNSPKTKLLATKALISCKNIGVNTQIPIMKTKMTQFDQTFQIKIKKSLKKSSHQSIYFQKTQCQKQKSQLNRINRQNQKQIQSKNIVRQLVHYMSDKIIYNRIKRKN